ncbi:MAG: hypothetical protein HY812_15660 [Planctomycetes bacterium]|nr:hypothetical protein [Planctomycetota bacterium]
MRALHVLLLLALAAAAAACAAPPAPADFLVVDSGRGEVKAIAPDDSLFWVRQFKDGMRGDFAFWAEALEKEFVENRGYTLLEKRPVKWNGAPGVELLFEVSAAGRARRYLATMAVAPGSFASTIRVAEYVADKERFGEHLGAVRAALGT